jgi:hypothetical protein
MPTDRSSAEINLMFAFSHQKTKVLMPVQFSQVTQDFVLLYDHEEYGHLEHMESKVEKLQKFMGNNADFFRFILNGLSAFSLITGGLAHGIILADSIFKNEPVSTKVEFILPAERKQESKIISLFS